MTVILLWIVLGIVVFFAAVILLWLCSMRQNMPWQNCIAVLSNLKLPLPEFLKRYARSGRRDYSTLPQPLTMADGTEVTSPPQFSLRREEILRMFEQEIYGVLPKTGFQTSFAVVEEGEALDGTALRRQIDITVSTEKGASQSRMLLYLPKTEKKVPVVFGLNFRGNPTVLPDPSILPSPSMDTGDGKWEEARGSCAPRWNIADCIARGYAVATTCSGDFAPDHKERYAHRVVGLFDQPEFKAIGAWAFGLSRIVDCLTKDPAIDAERIAVIGHSRLGKAAVWAGANDPRIGLVISNDSGNTGASLSRGNHGETVFTICKAFPHWFCSRYGAYGKHENALPVDQNLLLACVAPRKLYVASAEDDLWSDPQGAWNSLKSASAAFALYHGQVLPPEMDTYPPVGQAFHCPALGAHMRAGGHDITAEDWRLYLQYMDRYFNSKG